MRGVIPIIRKVSSSRGFLFNKNYKAFFPELNYGGCGLTVMTSGCGPGKEGSTPSFRPQFIEKKEVKNEIQKCKKNNFYLQV